MELRPLLPSDRQPLYAYWRELSERIPYFFPVTEETWWKALTAEANGFMGLHLRDAASRILVAMAGDQLVGFVQAGAPIVDFDHRGNVVTDPTDVQVVRHLYFRPEHPAAGRALLQAVMVDQPGIARIHAFHHAHGISCNAHHGKLHEALPWIHDVLCQAGFTIEHANLYFSLDMTTVNHALPAIPMREEAPGQFEALMGDEVVGTARAVPLSHLTGGAAGDTVYLRWMGIQETAQGLGLGKRLLYSLIRHYRTAGHRHMHVDTAVTNSRAQQLYLRMGFQPRGLTRSYHLYREPHGLR